MLWRARADAGGNQMLVIAVFDDLSSLSDEMKYLQDLHTRVIHHHDGAQSATATVIRAGLLADAVDVVVWDVSPAISLYCDRLERLLDKQAFGGCGLIVTTTHAPRIRDYFGPRCREMTLLQRPFSTRQIDAALEASRAPHRS